MTFPVYPTQEYINRLVALLALEYPALTTARCHLYKNDAAPDANMSLATFVEADYAGYAAVALTMSVPSMSDQGIIVSKSNVVNFVSAGGAVAQSVYGIFVTNVDDDELIAAQRFDNPQVMGGHFPKAVSGVWRVSEPLSSYGWLDVEN